MRGLGIVGGLGPLASADFVLSIYEVNAAAKEQDGPTVFLYSDPSFPDRSELLLEGKEEALVPLLETALSRVAACGVERIVVACMTIHAILPRVRAELRRPIISLVDVALESVGRTGRRALLLATRGTRRTRIFEKSACWPDVRQLVVWPNECEQEMIHDRIYSEIKRNSHLDGVCEFIDDLCASHGVDCWIAGCTEFHRVTRYLRTAGTSGLHLRPIDPLMVIASKYQEFVNGQPEYFGDLCHASLASAR